jgi:hypothetical protein
MNRTPAMMWMMLACCIASRPWFQLGKSRIRPVTLMVIPRITTPAQNHSFSMPLKRPEGSSWPENMPPKRVIQRTSPLRHRLSRT